MDTAPTICALLERQLAERPNQTAFIEGEWRVSFAEFDRMCQQAAAWLASQGIGPGDRVAVWLVNRVEWLALLFALGRLGATMLSVNTRFRAAELEHVLARSAARLLVMQLNFRKIEFDAVLSEVNPAAVPALERVAVLDGGTQVPATMLSRPTVAFSLTCELQPGFVAPAERSSPDALSVLLTTSGTTKGPKLVMHAQGRIALHAQRVSHFFGFNRPDSGTLGLVPFCGTFGLVIALATFAGGAPLVIEDEFDAQGASELIRRHRLTHVFGTEEMLRRFLDANPQPAPFPSARVFGFIMGAELAQMAHERGLPVTGLYGSSEVQALFSRQPFDLPFAERALNGGKPTAADVELRVRDVSTGALLPAGASGELEIRSPTNFLGYLNDPEATRKAIDDEGFYRTGDLGRLRPDGTFVFETRSGDAMRISGFLVSPVEIEEVIRQVSGVAEAQVVAVEIEHKSRCAAFVVRAAGSAVSESDITAWVKARLAAYKVPTRVWFIEVYPVTHSANGDKIQRAKLREMAAQRLAQD